MITLENILYFILIPFVIFLYGYIIKIIYLYIKQIVKEKEILIRKEIFNIVPNTKLKKIFFLVFILVNLSMHLANREKWINKNTINHDAKEYLATYMDLHFYKKVLNNLFNIDNPIFIPLNLLTDQIYKRGITYLQSEDGEIAYWKFYFYGYFYTRGSGYMPNENLTTNIQPSTKEQIYILDMMFDISKTLATKTIEDKIVNLEKYKVFALSAEYFDNLKLWYFGNHIDSSKLNFARENEVFIKKLYSLLEWTIRFKNEYKNYPKLKYEIENEYPVLGVIYLKIPIDISEFLLLQEKYAKNIFNCDEPLIDIFMNYRDELINPNSPLYKLSKSQENRVKEFIFDTYRAYSVAFIVNDKCNKKVDFGYPADEWILKNVNFIKNK
ncbi:hypothetical protein [Arcobacter vandammei]|uniref:hypothetical protein n=1 Tax=Arcobacter vandammei TaxID=2782243 RepID=UPI0018DFB833|nr:hypothetical protein [Arcobacter vandammei]